MFPEDKKKQVHIWDMPSHILTINSQVNVPMHSKCKYSPKSQFLHQTPSHEEKRISKSPKYSAIRHLTTNSPPNNTYFLWQYLSDCKPRAPLGNNLTPLPVFTPAIDRYLYFALYLWTLAYSTHVCALRCDEEMWRGWIKYVCRTRLYRLDAMKCFRHVPIWLGNALHIAKSEKCI